jgi:hypothetical protein
MSVATSSGGPTPAPQVIIQQTAFGRYGKLLLVLLGFAVVSILGMSAAYQS